MDCNYSSSNENTISIEMMKKHNDIHIDNQNATNNDNNDDNNNSHEHHHDNNDIWYHHDDNI